MKIAVFYDLPEGGAKRAAEEQIKRLKARHTVDVYSIVKPLSLGVRGNPPPRWRADFFKFWGLKSFEQKLAQEIDRKSYDIVLVHPSKYTQAPYILKYLKTPSVYFCQEPLRICYEYNLRFQEKVGIIKAVYEGLTRFMLKMVDFKNTRSATRVIVNSYHSLETIHKIYGVYPQVCYLGVDTEYFHPIAGIKKEGILFVAKPSKITGFEFLKKAISLVKPRPKIMVVNKDLSEDQLVEAYNKAVLTACTSEVEPFGLVPLESMACQTPVVAVKEGGYRESVVEGVTGFLVERDPEIFAQKIKLLLENKELAYEMGKNGREYVKGQWSWEKSIKKLEAILEDTQGVKDKHGTIGFYCYC